MDNRIKALREKIVTHDMSRTPSYIRWCAIKGRCYNENDSCYASYGGRGISMFSEWQFNFALFHDYISTLDGFGDDKLSLDRIDNDKGYVPGNLRWATKREQCFNQRRRVDAVSGYTGVYKNRTTWKSAITVNGITVPIGYYKTIEEAVSARNDYIIENELTEHKIQTFHRIKTEGF